MEINRHRDFSLKHHFRDRGSIILNLFKSVFDDWINNYDQLNFNDYYLAVMNNLNNVNGFDYWRKFLIKNGRWYSSISAVCKHLFTCLDNANKLYIVKSNGDEEIIICHIHGIVKLNDDLFLLDDQCGQNKVSFLYGNIEYSISTTNQNEYSLKMNSNNICTNVNFECLLMELNNRIKDVF